MRYADSSGGADDAVGSVDVGVAVGVEGARRARGCAASYDASHARSSSVIVAFFRSRAARTRSAAVAVTT
jgi:hypothetical protein